MGLASKTFINQRRDVLVFLGDVDEEIATTSLRTKVLDAGRLRADFVRAIGSSWT
jgi:hypothetical protein